MNILIVSDAYPMPDRNSGDFRFSTLIGMIREKHNVFFCALGEKRQVEEIGSKQTARYREALGEAGIQVLNSGAGRALRERAYGAVLFEWYFTATQLIDNVREWQPNARLIVDAVDVVFNRLEAKSRVTKTTQDINKALETKRKELSVYDKADIVITVTDADAVILHRINPRLVTFTVPNIHPLQVPVPIPANNDKRLIFVGSFTHEPNIDAMHYLCEEVLPLIVEAEPEVILRIVGNAPTQEILQLASAHVEVLGYVPETRPFLETSTISIAPLRFGGGMKGKIGEAMSYGLPVVTTAIGIEGFGLNPGEHILVGNDPRSFADAVIKLLRDRDFLEQVRMAGHRFISEHYSDVAVRARVHTLFDQLESYPIKCLPLPQLGLRKAKAFWHRHIEWRLK
ncbi:MAG: glycosyltransferase family 4 protein [Candidatus Nitrotoga sp.]|nr:glycosyltransferase family 4 protein [Candidatus Nitrotoga sp.]